MTLIPATEKDFEQIYTLLVSCKEHLIAQNIWQWGNDYPHPAHVQADIRRGALLKYQLEKDIVGTISLDDQQEPEYSSVPWKFTGESIAVIHRLAVHPQLQGSGHGSLIMDRVEDIIMTNGFSSIRLDAYSGNPKLLEYYQKRGYRRAGEISYASRSLPFICFEKEPHS